MIWKPIVHDVDGQTTDLDIVTIVEIIAVKKFEDNTKKYIVAQDPIQHSQVSDLASPINTQD